ncbi:MAG TPA: substrate-binding domain-containing protein [Candidatus Limnocylindrales bacterium]|jgi:spermidine/putrescine-binding protein|nr:substrate-binding domain-containing protein [Candidatus Limnocylindrales bacterium]
MTGFDQGYSRRTFLRLTGALGTTAALGGVVAACNVVGSGAKTTGTFNWMTWGDHWIQTQLDKIAKDVNISTNISELSGNAEGYAKLKEVKGQLDKMSADAMWVPNAYFKDGLVEPFDINSLKVSSQLYSFAREFPYWQAAGGGYMAYPFGWSPIMIYYDPAKVTGNPTDWQVLLDPKYKGRIVVENQPEEIVAYMARAAGIDKPYDLTDDQLTTVKGYLEKLKPNVLKFAQQATDSVAAMVSGEAWLITGNIGNEDRVKDGGGPEIKGYVPSEGTVGWHDGEMIVKEGANKSLILPFLEQSQQAELIAENFLVNGRPLFNEKAYKILTDQGKKDQADRYLYGKAGDVLPKVVLKGPGTSTDKSIKLFNDIFGGG